MLQCFFIFFFTFKSLFVYDHWSNRFHWLIFMKHVHTKICRLYASSSLSVIFRKFRRQPSFHFPPAKVLMNCNCYFACLDQSGGVEFPDSQQETKLVIYNTKCWLTPGKRTEEKVSLKFMKWISIKCYQLSSLIKNSVTRHCYLSRLNE